MLIGGLDVGTTGCKLTIYNATVLLVVMQNCELPSNVLQQGLRLCYPLLDCETAEVRKIAIS